MQNVDKFDCNNAPVICELNGFKWVLGPESPEELDWYDGVAWCKSVGGELPPIEVLLMCYLNEEIKKQFTETNYWTSTEFAWLQYFDIGDQLSSNKTSAAYVRAVRKLPI